MLSKLSPLLMCLGLAFHISLGFTTHQLCQRRQYRKTSTYDDMKHPMVRNIDLAEAIVFYGRDCMFEAGEGTLQPGVEYLLDECQRDETAVVAILETDGDRGSKTNREQNIPKGVHIYRETQPPPNPRDLWEAIHSITINPKGFGGSSGFGTKAADPERSPLPKHVVVLCDSEDKTRAARFAGMRVLSLNDNDLADGIVDGWDTICMDDIATPGSFWLNPPHPRDDESNSVDPELVMLAYENNSNKSPSSTREKKEVDDSVVLDDAMMSDDQLSAILADLDPL